MSPRWILGGAFALVALTGCPTDPAPRSRTAEDFDEPEPVSSAAATDIDDPHAPKPPKETAPDVSRSKGTKGGVLVFWPRVSAPESDATARGVATRVQARLEALSKRAAGPRTIDVRPEPERLCPREGCLGTSVGAVVFVKDDACAVVAIVAGPGTASGHLLPWAGSVKLARDTVGFREAPEQQIKVDQYVPCANLFDGAANRDADIARAIAKLLPGH